MTRLYRVFNPLIFISLLIFIIFIAFSNLGGPALENWDEAWYGESTKQMLKTGNLVVLSWNQEPFFEKPPLYMWASAISSLVFGLNEFSLRFVSAISGVILVMLTFLYARKNWGTIPAVIAFVTLALNNVFIWRVRSGNIDSLLSLLVFLCFVLTLSKDKRRYIYLGLVFAAIYLTKTSFVLFPIAIFIAHEVLYKRKEIGKNISQYLKASIAFITLPLVWLGLGYLQVGKDFPIQYILKSDQGVGNFNLLNFKKDYIDYAYYSLQRRFFYLFAIGLGFVASKIKQPLFFLLFVNSIGLLVFLSFNERLNNWYLLPSMPFWSLICAYAIFRIFKIFNNNLLLIISFLLLTLYISYRTFTVNIMAIVNTSSTNAQKESSIKVKMLSSKDDIVIRLDHLFSTTVYYSDRKVIASPLGADTRSWFISRADLVMKIKDKEITWIVGTNTDISEFVGKNDDLSLTRINVNKEESILRVN